MTEKLTLDGAALKTLFLDARTHNGFTSQPVEPELLKVVFDLARMGPTSANCQPMRIVFLTSADAKEGLLPALGEGNRAKTQKAPVTALFAMDMQFHHLLPRVFPHADARAWFEGNQSLIEATAFRNATLQAGYFMLAARALGLDCGPMSGFDPEMVNGAYFAEGSHRINFICNLGYGSGEDLFARSPRLEFDEACRVI
jgi:3-hydroxypropanoate dehydrogenase